MKSTRFRPIDIIDKLDSMLASLALPFGRDAGVLLPLGFHSLYSEVDELDSGAIDPAFALSLTDFERVVSTLKGSGYCFIAPADLTVDLDPGGRFALLTLDDGYANQLRALPVLERHRVPATFFLSTGPIEEGTCFWWDVLYRNLVRRGATLADIRVAFAEHQTMTPKAIHEALCEAYGEAAMVPEGDLDRPMTVDEVKRLAQSASVTIGNHTRDHAILTRLVRDDAEAQVQSCQSDLANWTGQTPCAFAYPDGVIDSRLDAWSERAGLNVAFTIVPEVTHLPLSIPDLQIGRFQVHARLSVTAQLRGIRSPWSMGRAYRRLSRRLGSLTSRQ